MQAYIVKSCVLLNHSPFGLNLKWINTFSNYKYKYVWFRKGFIKKRRQKNGFRLFHDLHWFFLRWYNFSNQTIYIYSHWTLFKIIYFFSLEEGDDGNCFSLFFHFSNFSFSKIWEERGQCPFSPPWTLPLSPPSPLRHQLSTTKSI